MVLRGDGGDAKERFGAAAGVLREKAPDTSAWSKVGLSGSQQSADLQIHTLTPQCEPDRRASAHSRGVWSTVVWCSLRSTPCWQLDL